MKLDLAKYSGLKICVAVSGGRDSMALVDYLFKNASEHKITLSVLNCDHKIRGEASAKDSAFVKEWCLTRNIPLKFYEWNTDGQQSEGNARKWRLSCYRDALVAKDGWDGADVVATAHHLNDNAETVLFNLARGSYLSGMTGIVDGGTDLKLIRPLISHPRSEIEEYIHENNVPYVDDATNFTDDYTRNKIRHGVLTALEDAVPSASRAIYRFSRLAAEDEEYFNNIIESRNLISYTKYGAKIAPCQERVIFRRAVLKAIYALVPDIRDYTSDHLERLYNLQFADNGKKFEFLSLTAFKEDGGVAICVNSLLEEEASSVAYENYLIGKSGIFGGQPLVIVDGNDLNDTLKEVKNSFSIPLKVLKFDPYAVPEGAVVRFARHGDKFTKFGGGTKKLGDYFTDKKLPRRIRGLIPVIAVGADIYAVCGVEISDNVKITDSTERPKYLICGDYISIGKNNN